MKHNSISSLKDDIEWNSFSPIIIYVNKVNYFLYRKCYGMFLFLHYFKKLYVKLIEPILDLATNNNLEFACDNKRASIAPWQLGKK